MKLIKGRGEDSDARSLTYHGSAPRRVILKSGMQAKRISMAIEMEGGGATRNHDRDAPGPRRQGAPRRPDSK